MNVFTEGTTVFMLPTGLVGPTGLAPAPGRRWAVGALPDGTDAVIEVRDEAHLRQIVAAQGLSMGEPGSTGSWLLVRSAGSNHAVSAPVSTQTPRGSMAAMSSRTAPNPPRRKKNKLKTVAIVATVIVVLAILGSLMPASDETKAEAACQAAVEGQLGGAWKVDVSAHEKYGEEGVFTATGIAKKDGDRYTLKSFSCEAKKTAGGTFAAEAKIFG